MFYPRFAELSRSRDPATVDALDQVLADCWRGGYRRIGHTYVARELAIAEDVAADLLLEAADLGIVAAKFDLRCPHCGHVVAVSSVRDVPVGARECPVCCGAFSPSDRDVFITFEVLPPSEGDIRPKKVEGGRVSPPPTAEALSFGTLGEVSPYFRERFAPAILFQLPSAGEYRSLLERSFTEWKAAGKGDALEELAKYLLDAVEVFRFEKRDYDTLTGEVDLLYSVVPLYPFHDWGKWLLVECKNWSDRVDAGEIRKFAGKMKEGGAQVGLLVAPQGVTGPKGQNAEGVITSCWQVDRIRIITLTRTDLEGVASRQNFCEILKARELEVCFPSK